MGRKDSRVCSYILIEKDGKVGEHTERRRGRRGGKEEARRLPTIGADVTSTERESSRMQLFDHPGGRPSPPLLPSLHHRHLIFRVVVLGENQSIECSELALTKKCDGLLVWSSWETCDEERVWGASSKAWKGDKKIHAKGTATNQVK